LIGLIVVENPYGLEALWRGGDWIAKGTLLILVIMSMASWFVILTKFLEQSKLMKPMRVFGLRLALTKACPAYMPLVRFGF
jgi:biopolymer transport protein ExbB